MDVEIHFIKLLQKLGLDFVQRMLCNKRSILDYTLFILVGPPLEVYGHVDASWASKTFDKKSIIGFMFLFGNAIAHWSHSK